MHQLGTSLLWMYPNQYTFPLQCGICIQRCNHWQPLQWREFTANGQCWIDWTTVQSARWPPTQNTSVGPHSLSINAYIFCASHGWGMHYIPSAVGATIVIFPYWPPRNAGWWRPTICGTEYRPCPTPIGLLCPDTHHLLLCGQFIARPQWHHTTNPGWPTWLQRIYALHPCYQIYVHW